MKKFTSLIFLMFFALGFSQNNPVTFETGAQGGTWTFSNFDNGPSPTIGFEKVQNPFKSGINTSETVGKFTALAGKDLGGSGAGCQSKHGVDLGTFKLSYANSTIKIMVYKTVKSPVGIKFAEADGGSNGELTVTNTKINEWEELTFDFTERIGATKSGAIDQLILFMDVTADRPEATVSYFDNITFSKSLAPAPVVACDAILKDALEGTFVDGYKVKFETVGANVNITFELLDEKPGLVAYLHRQDPFLETRMTQKLGTKIFTHTITGQTKGDILSYACKFEYAGGLTKTKYIKYEVGSFCDGIAPTVPTAAAPTPTASAPNVISLFSGAYTNKAGTNWNPNWGQTTVSEEVSIAGNATRKYSNFNYQGVVFQTPVDASTMTKLHVDVWSTDCNEMKVFLIPTTGIEKSIIVKPALLGWNSFDITLVDYTNVDLKSIKELKFESVTAGTTVYLDNIYFVKAVDPSLSMNAPVTFETGDHGDGWKFTNFDNGAGTEGYEKVANPFATGINTSATVGKYTATVDGTSGTGCKTNDIGKFTFDTKNSTVKMMVYKTVLSDVSMKFAVADGGSLGEIKVKNTKINEWEELTFDFYNQIGKEQSTNMVTMIISLDNRVRTEQTVSYFDNITFSKTTVASPVQVCDAVLKEASQGSFTTGYKANFATVGTDVNITFELLDARDGLVAGLWKESPFAELPMVNTPAGSKIYTAKLTNQKVGDLISYACKFAYAEGQSVTKYIKYEVGTACTGTTPPPVVTGPTLPLDFETGTFAFTDFDGGAVTIVDNPSKTGINTTAKVAKMVKGAGAIWAGSKIKLTSAVDFSTNKTIKVKVWSPVAGKKLLLKFEGAGAAFQKELATTVANTWEELTFDYTGVAGVNNLNDNMVFIFDLGTSGDGSANSTYYFDEITQLGTTPPVVTGPTIPLDFETGTIAFTDFDGGAVTIVDNPSKTGINTTAKVAKMVKGAGAIWAGSKIKLTSAVDFSTKKLFKVKVWSPVAGKKLLLKFEGSNGNFEKESVGVTAANTWEELTFDFTNVSTNNTASDMVFIFDLGTSGDGSANSTYYFDEITQSAGAAGPAGAKLPLDFEAAAYSFVDFGGGTATKVANPQSNGINTSANVAKMVKGAGETYAGSKIKMAAPVDFATNKLFKVKVWSPVAGKKLLLKFEGLGGNFEQESTGVTAANTWEELTFDFSKVGTNNVADFMVFMFDFGTVGNGTANSTYYFDDVQQASIPVAPSTNYHVSFETGSVIGTWDAFENPGQTGFEFANNPSKTGINTTDKVGKFTAVVAGQPWAGCETASGTIGTWELDATSKIVTMMVYKSDISPVGIKMATSYNGTTFEIKQKNTKINEWELMTFDISKFITSADATKINKFVVFPDFRSDADPIRNKDVVFYFDDIKFSAKKLHDPNYVAPPVDNPTVAASVPPVRNAGDVKSIFSDAYAVYKAGNWCQCWGQSTVVSEIKIDGNTTRKLENFTYQGVTLADGEVFNVLDMNKVHIDLWFNDAKSVSLALIQKTPGGSVEAALKFTPTKEGWNSFDLDLNATTLPGVDLSKVFQLKLTSEKQGSNVFLDNFYFWKDATTALAQMDLPVTFDDTTVDYSLLGFGGTEGSSIVVDPTLATNKVAKVFKPKDSETWAGVTISAAAGLGFKNPIPFSTSVTKMSVRVWSPDAGTIIRLKVEDHKDKTRTVETETAVTTSKGWETVVFDFAKPVSGTAALNAAYTYDKATIFFGFGTTGTEKIYYFDNVQMVEVSLAPVLSYGVESQTYPLGKSIYPLKIVNSGGIVPVKGYAISPTLPEGLSFDANTATISGIPSALSAATLYTITGTNASGVAKATVSLNVVRDLASNNFTIETRSETCLGEKNGEIRIKAAAANTYIALINGTAYEFSTGSLRVFNLAPGEYTITITVKGTTTAAQEFVAVIGKGSTIILKTSKLINNKLTVEMTEGSAPYTVYLDGVEQFETPFATFLVEAKSGSLLEVKTAKICEGTYSKVIEGLLEVQAAFPNPTSGSFEIAIPFEVKEVEVALYAMSGILISNQTYPVENGTIKLSLNGQSNGIYMAKVNLETPSYLRIIKK